MSGPNWSALAKREGMSEKAYRAKRVKAMKLGRAKRKRSINATFGTAHEMAKKYPPSYIEVDLGKAVKAPRAKADAVDGSVGGFGGLTASEVKIVEHCARQEKKSFEQARAEFLKAKTEPAVRSLPALNTTPIAGNIQALGQILMGLADLTPAHRQIVRDVLGGGGE